MTSVPQKSKAGERFTALHADVVTDAVSEPVLIGAALSISLSILTVAVIEFPTGLALFAQYSFTF